jgi:ubiquitin-protein ligase
MSIYIRMVLFVCRFYMMVVFEIMLEWSPALTVNSIVLSILSMLSSATKKVKPFNDG